MNFREVEIFSGHRFQVPEHIQRLDSKHNRGWQLRYGKWSSFPDGTTDGSGAGAALALAVKELQRRIARLPAPTGLRQAASPNKNNGLPVGISGPIRCLRKGRKVAEYNFGITIPRFGAKPTTGHVYIGTDNTVNEERYAHALAKAIALRAQAERAFQAAATRAKRETWRGGATQVPDGGAPNSHRMGGRRDDPRPNPY